MHSVPRAALLAGTAHQNLLDDAQRLDAYAEAVRRVVKEGDVVADVGSGSGVLAHLAVQAGARLVYAIEENSAAHRLLMRHVQDNELLGAVVPVLADGTRWAPSEPVDVLLCELMETALLQEPIAEVLHHVHRAWPRRPRAVVPGRVELLVEGAHATATHHGFRTRLPGWRHHGAAPALTGAVPYAAYDFAEAAPPARVEARVTLTAERGGRMDALQLRTVSEVAPGARLESSPAYCSPLVIPLDRALDVQAGDRVDVHLAYAPGAADTPLDVDAELTRA